MAILCFYEEEGYVDSYIYYLVKELLSISSKVIIVSNGKMEEKARVYFEQCHCVVWIRENKGYDASAYKYAITRIGRDKLKNFDQIILCNDTFFGPFISMKSIFGEMDANKCDFWGISYQDTNLVQFIGSYFLVFGERTIQSDDLFNYFEKMQEIVEYQDALIYFEFGIFLYFKRKGYIIGSCVSKKKYFSNVIYPYENLKYEHLPIIKKRAFMINNDWDLTKAMRFIQDNYDYNINLIQSWMERKKLTLEENNFGAGKCVSVKVKDIPKVCINDIYRFINQWKNIYIYGNGYYGHILVGLYQIRPQLIIVSDGHRSMSDKMQYRGIPIKEISEIDIKNKEVGIIVALNKVNTEVAKMRLGEDSNILYIW